jgi:two-component system cell cycle response regulator
VVSAKVVPPGAAQPGPEKSQKLPLPAPVGSGPFASGARASSITEPNLRAVRPGRPALGSSPVETGFAGNEEPSTSVESSSARTPALQPQASLRTVLIRMDGVGAGRLSRVESDSVVLGRDANCEVSIDDQGVSRRHARLTRVGNQHEVSDLGSSNGTFVAGARVERAVLRDGDFIQLGPRVCFRYSQIDECHERVLRDLCDLSTKDPLTRAHNRRYFDEHLKTEIAFAQRHRNPVSLLLIDIDHFKSVNDTWGHQAGDAVLQQVARAAQQRLRSEDVFARYGGEEFGVILRATDQAGAVRVAERVRATIAAVPALVAGKPIAVTVSIGCATLGPAPSMAGEGLLAIADARLYRAKALGRNKVVWSD